MAFLLGGVAASSGLLYMGKKWLEGGIINTQITNYLPLTIRCQSLPSKVHITKCSNRYRIKLWNRRTNCTRNVFKYNIL